MKVLFLALDVHLDMDTGDAVHVLALSQFLAARGHLIDVIGVGSVPAHAAPSGVQYHRAPTGSDWRLVRFCSSLARGNGCDVIYERRLSPKIAFAVSRLCSKPFVVEINGIAEEAEMLRTNRSRPLLPLRARARQWMFRASRVVTVTDRLADRAREQYHLSPERITTVPNGVDVERFKPIDRAEARRGLPPLDGRWIVFVGNLVPWQGLDTLIRASPALHRDHGDLRFIVIGDGVQRHTLENLATEVGTSNRFAFVGAIPHDAVPAYINASEVCVAPFSRRRNEEVGLSPLKLYEYLSCARPVVASDLPGLDFVRLQAAGVLIPPDNPDALADALSHLLKHPEDARAMGERGRAYVVRERSWAQTAERIEHVLLEARRAWVGA